MQKKINKKKIDINKTDKLFKCLNWLLNLIDLFGKLSIGRMTGGREAFWIKK